MAVLSGQEEEDDQPQHIYEARDEKMVSIKDAKSKWRLARFLLPLSKTVQDSIFIPPTTPLLSDILPHTFHPPNVVCKGWNSPQHKWKQWVLQLAPKFEPIWVKAGIRDAIFSSTYELRFNQEIVLGLAEFWCTQTNTFVFPWGEATITLEDVMILGGYPLLGELVDGSLTGDLERIVRKLEKFRAELLKSKSKKADHSSWLKHFIEEDNEIRHVAFLSLWLSRYVFPSRFKDTLESSVFPIAAKLSRGFKLALGPVILANVYCKLREFTQAALESSMEGTVIVPGHFQLLQVWAFERFPALVMGLKSPNVIDHGEPRMARWHRVNFKINLPLVRSALKLAENFEWRPYAADLENWHHPSFYKESEQLVFDYLSLDEELQSYVRSLRASELVSSDGRREKYLPNRVAMQFGLDQDLPADVLNFKCTRELVSAFVPSRSFQPGVSLRYSNWWKESMIAREGAIKDLLLQKRSLKDLGTSSIQANGSKDKYHTESDSSNLDERIVHASTPRPHKTGKTNTSLKSAVQKRKRNGGNPKVSRGLKNVTSPGNSSKVSKEAAFRKRRRLITKSNFMVKKDVHKDSSDVVRSRKVAAGLQKRSCNLDKDVDIPEVSCALKNVSSPRNSSEVSKEAAFRMSRKPMTKSSFTVKKNVYVDSSDDDLPIVFRRRSCNITKEAESSSSCIHERVEKEKLSATKKNNSQEKVTFESVSPFAKAEQTKMGDGSMNPINIDDDSDKSGDDRYCSRPSKCGKDDLEGRIQKLEKMLGVSQERD